MLIVSKCRDSIINAEQTEVIYVGSEGRSIKVSFASGKGCQLAAYNSEQEALAAMNLLADNIGRADEVYFMPLDEQVKAEIQRNPMGKERCRNGKKTKGHGGS